ncbi:hypothetical protein RJ639_013083 [Escallonia herrerae]|uniref:DUF7705 domain-containing protein n=1 Tax=Escallonia herrerae TaxID=1293975 RepID=A0AA89ANQ5_9ASTE|nr:hypothetical protein RJ639_013083 [Escallonia herrerae]
MATMVPKQFCSALFAAVLHCVIIVLAKEDYISAIGDPGMRRDGLRVAIEAWNQCNEVGEEAPGMGSPREADCFDVHSSRSQSEFLLFCYFGDLSLRLIRGKHVKFDILLAIGLNCCNTSQLLMFSVCPFFLLPCAAGRKVKVVHRVGEKANKRGISSAKAQNLGKINVNQYAAWKEKYLGRKCQVQDVPNPWQFWMIMLKSGNMDTLAAVCPKNGMKRKPFTNKSQFPCFGKGCMNMPLIFHDYTSVHKHQGKRTLRGSFYGTWDLKADIRKAATKKETSYFSVTWEKEVGKGSWVFHHVLKTSKKYPWLMLYLRSDATSGFSGGYHYQTRGMSKIVPKSPDFKVIFTLDIKRVGGPKSQFYLMDIGGCWKNNGQPCNGDVTSDVTRYSEMIINPSTDSWCNPGSLASCPPYHTRPDGTRIHRSDKRNFPMQLIIITALQAMLSILWSHITIVILIATLSRRKYCKFYHILFGERTGTQFVRVKVGLGIQELGNLMLGDFLRHSTSTSNIAAFVEMQDPGTVPMTRYWPSIDLGTEIYISSNECAEWSHHLFRPMNNIFRPSAIRPGMQKDGLRVAIEAWNQCNEVGFEAPYMGSPREADCFDLDDSMTPTAVCPDNGKKALPFPPEPRFPCFGKGCMNMPLIFHNYTSLQLGDQGTNVLRGSFYGTWDWDADVRKAPSEDDTSYFAVNWEKEVGNGSWIFHHLLKTSSKYPWLMLYLRSDATKGLSGGNAEYLEEPINLCDPYSNPQPQEILQILPNPVWGEYGYPAKKGQGWIGDPRTWELDVGRLSHLLYFYQDPGTVPVKRDWPSIDLGTEIYVSGNEVAEWTVSDFDIIVPNGDAS